MILLTGVTGKTGGETAKQLLARGAKLRAIVRNEAKAAELKAAGVELVVGDVGDAETVRRALKGVEKAFLTLPNGKNQEAQEKQFTDLAVAAGLKHLVKMSSMEAVAHAQTPIPKAHWAVEEHIRASGLPWTMVKPNFFMQNLLSSAAGIKANRNFSLPMGNGTTGMADVRDIAAVCTEVLTGQGPAGKGHAGQSYEITGPEVLTFHQVADRFTAVLGEKVEYVPMPTDQFRERMKNVLEPWHLNAVCELFREIAEIGLDHTTDTFRKLMGRDPRSVTQFIQDHLALFR
ncbi:MAG: SDR family oxidoreductase [Gammaproteobacteria bacterium]|nr:SDR family oxidoreductase [Gammaproteobacteria bacterium]